MTSKRSSLENSGRTPQKTKAVSFLSLVSENLRRNLWLTIVGMTVMLFAYPVNMGMQMSYYSGKAGEKTRAADFAAAAGFREDMTEAANRILGGEYSLLWLIISVAAVLCALGMFGWLYNKNKVDFYNSQPVSREKRFLSLWFSGLAVMLICLFAGFLSALFIAVAYGAEGLMTAEAWAISMGFVLMFIFVYSIAVAVIMLTGNRMTFFMGLLWVCILAYVTSGLVMAFGDMYFETGSIGTEAVEAINKFSPVYWLSRYYSLISFAFYNSFQKRYAGDAGEVVGGELFTVILTVLIASVIISALSLFLFKKRASESAGKALSFKATKRPVRMLFTVVISLIFCLFGSFIGMSINAGDVFWTLFFLVAGAVIAHAVIEVIYSSDLKAMLRDKRELFICILISVFILSIFRFDLLRYDRHVPRADEVESIDISSTDFLPYKQSTVQAKGFASENGDYDYSEEDIRITGTENIENMIELIKSSNELTGRSSENDDSYGAWYVYSEDFDKFDHYIYMSINYRSGSKDRRHYNIPAEAVREYLAPVLSDKEVKRELFPILDVSEEDFGLLGFSGGDSGERYENEIYYNYGFYGSHIQNLNDSYGREAALKVFEALKKDLMEADFDEITALERTGYDDKQNANLERLVYVPRETVINKELELRETGLDLEETGGYDLADEYYILPGFENTRRALEEIKPQI